MTTRVQREVVTPAQKRWRPKQCYLDVMCEIAFEQSHTLKAVPWLCMLHWAWAHGPRWSDE